MAQKTGRFGTKGQRGASADFILQLATCGKCLRELAAAARRLPEGDDYHEVRDQVGTLLNRIVVLEDRAVKIR